MLLVIIGILRVYPSVEINRELEYKHMDWYAKALADTELDGITLTTPRYNDFSGQPVVSLLGRLLELPQG